MSELTKAPDERLVDSHEICTERRRRGFHTSGGFEILLNRPLISSWLKMIRFLLLALTVGLLSPTAAKADNDLEEEYSNTLANNSLLGSLVTACYAKEMQYIDNIQKQDLAAVALEMHEFAHATESLRMKDQMNMISKAMTPFTDCFPEYKQNN